MNRMIYSPHFQFVVKTKRHLQNNPALHILPCNPDDGVPVNLRGCTPKAPGVGTGVYSATLRERAWHRLTQAFLLCGRPLNTTTADHED